MDGFEMRFCAVVEKFYGIIVALGLFVAQLAVAG